MPVFVGKSGKEFVIEAKTGVTPLTLRLGELFANPMETLKHPHWPEFCKPNHLDVIDDGCREALGMEGLDFVVAHLNAYPKEQKEMGRQAIQLSIESGRGVFFRWALYDGDAEEMTVEPDGKRTFITFYVPRAKALAELHGCGMGQSAAVI